VNDPEHWKLDAQRVIKIHRKLELLGLGKCEKLLRQQHQKGEGVTATDVYYGMRKLLDMTNIEFKDKILTLLNLRNEVLE